MHVKAEDETKSSRVVCCSAWSTKTLPVHGNEVTEGKSEAWPSPHFLEAHRAFTRSQLVADRLVTSLLAVSNIHPKPIGISPEAHL